MINIVFPAAGRGKPHHEDGDEKTNASEVSLKPAFKTLILRVFIIIVYMCLGALVFCAIEHKNKDMTVWKRRTRMIKDRLMLKYNITLVEMTGFENAVEQRAKENREGNKEWSYYQSLYFASTVTTTIGKSSSTLIAVLFLSSKLCCCF